MTTSTTSDRAGMTATLTDPCPGVPPLTRRKGGRRERLAGLERPLQRRTTAFLDRALELKETP